MSINLFHNSFFYNSINEPKKDLDLNFLFKKTNNFESLLCKNERITSPFLYLKAGLPLLPTPDSDDPLPETQKAKIQNFDTMTRGINTNALTSRLVKALPVLSKKCIDEISGYLDNRAMMFILLNQLKNKETTIDELLFAIRNENWGHPLFDQPNIDMYLLEALRRNLLNHYEFSWVTLFLMAKKIARCMPTVLPVINKSGKLDKLAEIYLALTFLPTGRDKGQEPILDERQFSAFIRELRHFPRSEHSIILIPFTERFQNGVLGRINKLGLNIFGRVSVFLDSKEFRFKEMLMVAPLGMVQAFLNVKFGAKAIKLSPAIGPMPVSELRDNALEDTRVVSLDHSILDQLMDLKFPSIADGLDAPGVCFTYHDSCYHSYISSSIPPGIRRRFVKFYDFIRAHLVSSPTNQGCSADEDRFFRKLSFMCIDMEHPSFRPEILFKRPFRYQSFGNIIWATISTMIFYSRQKISDDKLGLYIFKLCRAFIHHDMINSTDFEAIESELSYLTEIQAKKQLPILEMISLGLKYYLQRDLYDPISKKTDFLSIDILLSKKLQFLHEKYKVGLE